MQSSHIPRSQTTRACMIGDKGYDSDGYRAALKAKDITPCIPTRKGRILPAGFDRKLYRQRLKAPNMFAKLKDSRRVHTRYDRGALTFMSAIAIAKTGTFWLN